MSLAYESDTIAAIATPIGEGGISVIRISGGDALVVADRGFRGKVVLGDTASHTAHFGEFVDEEGSVLDQIVALVFRSPHSYTGENVVELSCHGGMFVTRIILDAVIRYGSRPAQPGEFTKRSFLNGRMDLAQAEAVADLIHARSEAARRSSLQQLQGNLSERLKSVKEQLMDTIGLLELELDFAEDGYEFVDKSKVARQVESIIAQLSELIASYRIGKVYRDGVRVVLAGAPNVGKSSLLNALLQENRAIVTDIPGTTRDAIEESITIDGILFTLTDTAGLRETHDPVEKEGVKRTEEKLVNSDLVLVVIDSSSEIPDDEIIQSSDLVRRISESGASYIVVLNKTDLANKPNRSLIEGTKSLNGHPSVWVSAKTHSGLDLLKKSLVNTILSGKSAGSEGSITVTNARHYSAILKSRESLEQSLKTLEANRSSEFVAVDLRSSLDSLGEISGAVTTDDILNRVFSNFCIGK